MPSLKSFHFEDPRFRQEWRKLQTIEVNPATNNTGLTIAGNPVFAIQPVGVVAHFYVSIPNGSTGTGTINWPPSLPRLTGTLGYAIINQNGTLSLGNVNTTGIVISGTLTPNTHIYGTIYIG
ncbi:hypothetical protein [Microcystis sp. M42BS1]|uniref:hypothetical protein n=1 Tax=Microcystis sp. M42BS1 TaxID=2771192 RepID=UPI00258BBD57|nr:hypothetical protein [Microcystis sp. M42BS1]MCA2570711.1 hypothetical protein [Microcystis sp. M42BS1]